MVPIVPNPAHPNSVEYCKNLLFASHYKQCNNASELLQKVVALKCIQENTVLRSINASIPSCSSSNPAPPFSIAALSPLVGFPFFQELLIERKEPEPTPTSSSGYPIFFNSMTAMLKNLHDVGVDPVVAESIALDRLTSPAANPQSFMSMINGSGKPAFPLLDLTMEYIKRVLKKLHDHENFTADGAPYPFEVKSALRYSEYLHSKIPDLRKINPPHVAHEHSITLTALGRFMAMHEIVGNIDLHLVFPGETSAVEESAYYSALFWTYREAFKNFYYPSMPPPLPKTFKLTIPERQLLNRYWNAGNRHVTKSESVLLARRCPSLEAYQVYNYFERRRRRVYNKYRFEKDAETLAKETALMGENLKDIKKVADEDSDDDDDDVLLIQREFLSKFERAKLQDLWNLGHRKPSRNECELFAAEIGIQSGDQIYAYFEDRVWRLEYQQRKKIVSASKKKPKK